MPNNQRPKIVFLTGGIPLYWIIANALAERFGDITVVCEQQEDKSVFLKRRRKLVGPVSYFGQLAFGGYSKLVLDPLSRGRQQRILKDNDADDSKPNCETHQVDSVNSDECRALLQVLNPDIVFVVGTRIIKKPTLECVSAPFVNYHPGRTPKYRGMLGAYWTLVNKDHENLAFTYHLVDEHVDTGDILYQGPVEMPPGNNVRTYSHVMAVEARSLACQIVDDVMTNELRPYRIDLPSKQWFHPTIWGYFWHGLTKWVW